MYNEQDRVIRKKDRNITPFVHLSPRLNNQTPSDHRTRVLQRLWTTVREKDVQLDNINNVPRGIANSTGAVGTESIMVSPVMTETTLVLKTSGGVTWSG